MYEKDFLEKIKMFGLLKYNLKKILSILKGKIENEKKFITDFRDETSEVFKYYRSGFDNSDFAVEKPMFDEALKGNIDAAKFLNEKRERQTYDEMVTNIFGEDEI